MSGRLFGYSRISGILRQVWDVSMHLAIDLDVLYHFVSVGFQATIHIVNLDACDSSRGGVIEFRRQVLSQGVILAMLLPSGDDVPLFPYYHLVHRRYLFRKVLKVGVHSDYHIACGLFESTVKSGGFSVIASEADAVNRVIRLRKPDDFVPRVIGGAVVHHNDFVGKVCLF